MRYSLVFNPKNLLIERVDDRILLGRRLPLQLPGRQVQLLLKLLKLGKYAVF